MTTDNTSPADRQEQPVGKPEQAEGKPAKKPRPRPTVEQKYLILGKPYRIVLLDGKAILATLRDIDSYNLLVEINEENQVKRLFLPKHSVRYILLPTE